MYVIRSYYEFRHARHAGRAPVDHWKGRCRVDDAGRGGPVVDVELDDHVVLFIELERDDLPFGRERRQAGQNGQSDQNGTFAIRITSYNVCYTKLLRCRLPQSTVPGHRPRTAGGLLEVNPSAFHEIGYSSEVFEELVLVYFR